MWWNYRYSSNISVSSKNSFFSNKIWGVRQKRKTYHFWRGLHYSKVNSKWYGLKSWTSCVNIFLKVPCIPYFLLGRVFNPSANDCKLSYGYNAISFLICHNVRSATKQWIMSDVHFDKEKSKQTLLNTYIDISFIEKDVVNLAFVDIRMNSCFEEFVESWRVKSYECDKIVTLKEQCTFF